MATDPSTDTAQPAPDPSGTGGDTYESVGIDPRNNPESRATETRAAPPVSRGGSGSVVPAEQAPELEHPEGDTSGTGGGDPLGGVTASEADLDDAVEGKAGPEPTTLGQN